METFFEVMPDQPGIKVFLMEKSEKFIQMNILIEKPEEFHQTKLLKFSIRCFSRAI